MSNYQPPKSSLAVLVSGSGSNLQAIIDACQADAYPARVDLVLSNRQDAYACRRAREHDIACTVIDDRECVDKTEFEGRMLDALASAHIDYVALAGFMRILSAPFIDAFSNRLLNIHPSLLPAYKGLNTHQRVLSAGEKKHGASVHFVSKDLDGGPIVLQKSLSVQPNDTPQSLAARVLEIEHHIYPKAVGWLTAGRLSITSDGIVLLDGGSPS